jgi:hypothetical protein
MMMVLRKKLKKNLPVIFFSNWQAKKQKTLAIDVVHPDLANENKKADGLPTNDVFPYNGNGESVDCDTIDWEEYIDQLKNVNS